MTRTLRYVFVMSMAALGSACSSQSTVLRNDTGQTYKCKNEGWGWIGAPVAMANQSSCIKKAQAAGYYDTGAPGGSAPSVPKAVANATRLNVAFPAGWESQPVSDQRRAQGVVISAHNRTTDSFVIVALIEAAGITDRDVFVSSRRAALESRMKEATHTDFDQVEVNGRSAKRFEVTGILSDGQRMTYLFTAIFGESQIVVVNSWTSAANFADQESALEGLPERVSGLQ